jgi:hypothetical protein
MSANPLQPIADAVIRRAQQQGSILPREVRALLGEAGQAEDQWRDVMALTRTALRYQGGRYYPASGSDRARREQDQKQLVLKAVRQMVRLHRAASRQDDRREQARTDFVHLVKVRTADGKEYTLLSRDISAAGIRLVGTRRLLGQKVSVLVPPPAPAPAGAQGWAFSVRILWTCNLGDDLFENGGTFLELLPPPEA